MVQGIEQFIKHASFHSRGTYILVEGCVLEEKEEQCSGSGKGRLEEVVSSDGLGQRGSSEQVIYNFSEGTIEAVVKILGLTE